MHKCQKIALTWLCKWLLFPFMITDHCGHHHHPAQHSGSSPGHHFLLIFLFRAANIGKSNLCRFFWHGISKSFPSTKTTILITATFFFVSLSNSTFPCLLPRSPSYPIALTISFFFLHLSTGSPFSVMLNISCLSSLSRPPMSWLHQVCNFPPTVEKLAFVSA